jgi:hypothetical protein
VMAGDGQVCVDWFRGTDPGVEIVPDESSYGRDIEVYLVGNQSAISLSTCSSLRVTKEGTTVGLVTCSGRDLIVHCQRQFPDLFQQMGPTMRNSQTFPLRLLTDDIRSDGKLGEDVAEFEETVLIDHPNVLLATYVERRALVDFDLDGNIVLSSRGPFWGEIPITPSLIDPDIGEWITRTTKFTTSKEVLWSVYVGPGAFQEIRTYAVDNSAYHIARAVSGWFKTAGTVQEDPAGGIDCLIGKWTEDGECLWYTFIGGARDDQPAFAVTDSEGNVYVLASTKSFDFPTLSGFIQEKPNPTNTSDVVLFSLAPDGKTLRWSTFLSSRDSVQGDTASFSHGAFPKGMLIDDDDNLYVSFSQFYPTEILTTEGAYSRKHKAGLESALMKIDSQGNLVWSTLVNTDGDDNVERMFWDNNDNIVIYISQYSDVPGSRRSAIEAIGVPGKSETVQGYQGFVFRFNRMGVPNLVWTSRELPHHKYEVDLHIDDYGNTYTILETPVDPVGAAVFCSPNNSALPPTKAIVSVTKTRNYTTIDTLLATPVLGAKPSRVYQYRDRLMFIDNDNMPNSGACVTDTLWNTGVDLPVKTQSYLVVLQSVVSSIGDEKAQPLSTNNVRLKVWPNPVADVLGISGLDFDGKASVRIGDMTGRSVLLGDALSVQGKCHIDVRCLPAGAYVLYVVKESTQYQSLFCKW